MRGQWMWTAALLAPALVSAGWMAGDSRDHDIASTTINLLVPGPLESPDVSTVLTFHVDVLASDQICGYGNLTLNGQELAQEPSEFASIGEGSIDIDGKAVEASWAFFCLDGFYGPYAQRLDFNVLFVDGTFVDDVAFWVEFKQNGAQSILSTSAAVEDSIIWEAMPDSQVSTYEDNDAPDDYVDAEVFDFDSELAELNWMRELVQEFKYQIHLKEEAMAMYLSEENLLECDSLKCVIRNVYSKARVTTHKVIGKVYSKLSGETESEHDMRPPWKKPHGKNPHWGKPPFPPPPHGNHSHGNHACPGKGNHTHPPFSRPRPPPFCRCPLPPPPHVQQPRPPPPPHPAVPFVASQMDAPTDLVGPLLDGPPFDGPGSLSEFGGPTFDRKLYKIKMAVKVFAMVTLLVLLFAVIHRCCRCRTAARRQDKEARREERQRRRAFRRAAHKQAWRLWISRHIYRSPAAHHNNDDDDDLDTEEKHAMLAAGQQQQRRLRRRSSLIDSDAVASEISEFRNAVGVVSDIIAAEEGRMGPRASLDSRASLPDYASQLGGESLPRYEDGDGDGDGDGAELSGVVADGFRYTPGVGVGGGGERYTPGLSHCGNVRDVLGDAKE